MNMCLAHLCETYPDGCRTWLPRVSGNWRHRAENVNKAFEGHVEDHEFERGKFTEVRGFLAILSDCKASGFFVESFVYAGATAWRGAGVRM